MCIVSESRIVADFTDCADFKRFCVRGVVGCGGDAIYKILGMSTLFSS